MLPPAEVFVFKLFTLYTPPPDQVHPRDQVPPRRALLGGDTVYARAVRILLECNLVNNINLEVRRYYLSTMFLNFISSIETLSLVSNFPFADSSLVLTLTILDMFLTLNFDTSVFFTQRHNRDTFEKRTVKFDSVFVVLDKYSTQKDDQINVSFPQTK